MNYKHIYHAGNFADVLKHVILVVLIQALHQKDKPLCYIDTHAGRGEYLLNALETNKGLEYKTGIDRLMMSSLEDTFPLIKTYLEIVRQFGYPLAYPGSPAIAERLLKPNDRMICLELHPEEAWFLRNYFSRDARVSVHQQDGYLGLKGFLPPKERRGIILIDPPFEKSDEWHQILRNLELALKRFSTGVYAIWYPIKDQKAVSDFLNDLVTLGPPSLLIAELCIYSPDAALGLNGSGVAIINPPWQLDKVLEPVLQGLWETLAVKGAGRYRLEWLISPP